MKYACAKYYLLIPLLPCQAVVLSRISGSTVDLIQIILFGFIKWRTEKDDDGEQINMIGCVNNVYTGTRDPIYISSGASPTALEYDIVGDYGSKQPITPIEDRLFCRG